ncbi:hypothetical protein CDV31_000380 [Fusarium ambrosium]|uniref:Uncharacterized protein n=1 Tax=Fusarium ambrosium TaxID=131363 RepID=A0A428V2C9_9HYPO|nr:hypothetical protein CDV31_000380 [Fusarium ambrosium]
MVPILSSKVARPIVESSRCDEEGNAVDRILAWIGDHAEIVNYQPTDINQVYYT